MKKTISKLALLLIATCFMFSCKTKQVSCDAYGENVFTKKDTMYVNQEGVLKYKNKI